MSAAKRGASLYGICRTFISPAPGAFLPFSCRSISVMKLMSTTMSPLFAFSTIEEHVGGDGGDCIAEEVQVVLRLVELYRSLKAFGELKDLKGRGRRQWQPLQKRSQVLLTICEPFSDS
jgi:hypothetical protein